MPNLEPGDIDRTEITPKEIYFTRRSFLKAMGVASLGMALAACTQNGQEDSLPTEAGVSSQPVPLAEATADETGGLLTPYEKILNFTNFYEFSVSKTTIVKLAKEFRTKPWNVEISGLVKNPGVVTVDELLAKYPPQERVYRMRCVEGWSMVIPWVGFPLGALLQDAVPDSNATHVRFETILDPEQMPGQKSSQFPWPYQEALRLDEAMHDLTILATGLYGEPLPPQDGAPIRLVVPWKYGFKSIKSIIRIELVDYEPKTFWSSLAPQEYGFYANVNPDVPHPRWSQASETRIGESEPRPTLLFNGYSEQVAHLYSGMDLQKYY